MYLTRIETQGLRHVTSLPGLERTSPLPQAPAGAVVADALRLVTVALDPSRYTELTPLGWVDDDTEPLVDEESQRIDMLLGLRPQAVQRDLDDGVRTVAVDLSIAPDPPMYGRLREHAIRDPRLVTALGQEAELHVKAGFLITSDHTSGSPDLLGARMGDVSFPLAGKERPSWLLPLLADVADRFWAVDPDEPLAHVTHRLFRAATSHRVDDRQRWERAAAALQAAPFGLPTPGWLSTGHGMDLVFGPDLHDLRRLGRPARDAVRLVEAAIVRGPDVLVVPIAHDDAVAAWLRGCTEGDDATLEQVLVP